MTPVGNWLSITCQHERLSGKFRSNLPQRRIWGVFIGVPQLKA